MTPRRWLSALGCVVTLLLAVTGCGGDAPSSSAPAPATSPSTTPSGPAVTSHEPAEPTGSSKPTEPTEPTEPTASAPPEPAVAPATGAELTSEIISLRAPTDFGEALPMADGGSVRRFDELREFLELYAPRTSGAASPDQLIARQGGTGSTGQPMERLPDVLVDGQPAYHQVGPDPTFDGWREEFGLRYLGYQIIISLNTPLDTPQAERDEMNAAVLASAELLK